MVQIHQFGMLTSPKMQFLDQQIPVPVSSKAILIIIIGAALL